MILTFNISEPNLFRIHFDVQNPLDIINHIKYSPRNTT